MTTPEALISAKIRRRADGLELWFLRIRRTTGLPPSAFGVLVALAVTAIVASGALHPGIRSSDAALFLASGAFFGVSLGMIAGIMPRLIEAARADLAELAPLYPGDGASLTHASGALSRLTPGTTSALTALGIAAGILHAWLLGHMALPWWPALAQTLGTLALWVAMMLSMTPLFMNALLFDQLGRHAEPDLFDRGATAPFGTLALRPTLMVVGLQCAYPILFVGGGNSLAWATLIGSGVSLVTMSGLFFLPLSGIRARLRAVKRARLAEVDARIGELRPALRDYGPAARLDQLNALESLLALRERILRASTWPLDVAGIQGVLIYVILPPLTWAAAAFVEMAIDRSL